MSKCSPAGTTPAHASPVNEGSQLAHHEATASAQKSALPYSLAHTKSTRAATLKHRSTTVATFKDHDGVPRKVHRAITFAEPSPQLSERDSIFADHYVSNQVDHPSLLEEGGGGSEYGSGSGGDRKEKNLNKNESAGPTATATAMSTVMTQTVSPAASPTRQNLAKSVSTTASKYKLPQHHLASTSVTAKTNASGAPSSGRGTIHGVRRVLSDGHTWTKKFHLNVEEQHPNNDSFTEEPSEVEEDSLSSKMSEHTTTAEPSTNKSESMTSARKIIEGAQAARNERSVSRGRTRVDKSIEAKVKNPETSGNVRSRKASHMMGIFDPQDVKSIDDLVDSTAVDTAVTPSATRNRASPDVADDSLPVFSGDYFQKRPHLMRPEAISEERSEDTEPISPTGLPLSSPAERSRSLRRDFRETSLPSALLHEIRNSNRDQLTSILRSGPASSSRETQDDMVKEGRDDGDHELAHEEEEHISAAVYYPHSGPSAEEIENFEYPEENNTQAHPQKPGKITKLKPIPQVEQIDPDEPAHIDVSVESDHEQKRLHFHGNLQVPQEVEADDGGDKDGDDDESARTPKVLAVDEKPRFASVSASESEIDHSDEPGMLEEGATTPTQKDLPKKRDRSASMLSKPKGFVVLEPFKHQVGGHSTMYHLSRRAVCKQLNNRENEFYERVEQTHPDLLNFMPRYIGVLNVTFSKGPKQATSTSKDAKPEEDGQESSQNSSKSRSRSQPASHSLHGSVADNGDAKNQPRIVSHSQQIDTLPQVILNQNKHIIPPNYFDLPERPKSADPQHVRKSSGGYNSESGELASPNSSEGHQRSPARPAQPVHSPSWGTTTVNVGLRDRILREVFGPPPIKYHKRGTHSHSTLPKAKSPSSRRRSNLSVQSYDANATEHTAQRPHTAYEPEITTSAKDTSKLRPAESSNHGGQYSTSASVFEDLRNDLSKVTSANSENSRSEVGEEGRQIIRRRHSGMGLRRRRKSVSDNEIPELEYIEDEALLLGSEDEVFSMDEDNVRGIDREQSAPAQLAKMVTVPGGQNPDMNSNEAKVVEQSAALAETLPSNPRAARSKSQDQRYEFYIVLEDLTSGMGRPCILDLKMGTRQYGIEAKRSKVESQRRKCKTTTSGQLGVRICGMQTFNVATRTAGYEDKYFGRDVRAGKEFREALMRFLYDGVSYKSVAQHIPTLLHRLSKLESMVRRLPGYRFYGSSLILFYDAEPEKSKDYQEALKNGIDIAKERQKEGKKWPPPIELKLIDFANCVTSEDDLPGETNAPPAHPHEIDRGYLRGLKTLKAYFTHILKEIQSEEWAKRTETDDVILGDEKSVDGADTSTHKGTEFETEEEGEVSI